MFRGVFLPQLLHDQILHGPRAVCRLLQHICAVWRHRAHRARVLLLSSARNRKQNAKGDRRTL